MSRRFPAQRPTLTTRTDLAGDVQARLVASRILFGLGVLALAGAVALLLASLSGPGQGFEDLGNFVGALLLLGLAAIPFALSLALAPDAPGWLVGLAAAGCLLALLPAAAMLSAGVAGSTAFGALFLVAALAGLALAWRKRRRRATRIP